jgi:ankyrin repeat protein
MAVDLLMNNDSTHCISRNLLSAAFKRLPIHYFEGEYGKVAPDLLQFPGLHLAAHFGLDGLFFALIKRKAEVDINTAIWWETPLSLAVQRGHVPFVRMLLERNDVNIESKIQRSQHTALSIASSTYNDGFKPKELEDIITMLLDKGADVNSQCKFGRTLLFSAASYGNSVICNHFLKRGANVNMLDGEGWTPLLRACYYVCNEETVSLLLEKGADTSIQTRIGHTALSLALWRGLRITAGIVRLLLDNGTDINARDTSGMTALGVLRKRSKEYDHDKKAYEEIESLLLMRGGTL